MDLKSGMDYLAQNQAQMLDLTIRLAEINSGSYNIDGLHKVADLLKNEYAALNCEQLIVPVAAKQVINVKGEQVEMPLGPVLRCWKRPEAPMQVLLVGHMDTVYGIDHKFQKTKMVSPGMLNGPGVTDMKGGLVVMLYALKAFEQLAQAANLGWQLILSSDEEIGSTGSSELIEYMAPKHKVGFVFESAMDDKGTLVGQRKGDGNFTLVMHGKAAHAGRNFDQGRNAICKMAEVISKINALNGQREGLTINVGYVQGGDAVNVVPDCCVCMLDIRLPATADIDWVQHNLDAIVSEANQEEGFKLEAHGSFGRKPKILDAKTTKLYELVKSVAAGLGQDLSWQPSGGVCDGNNLSAAGLVNVDTLGVCGGKIHSSDEYLVIASLVDRAQLLMNILAHLSDNGFE